MKQRCYKCKKNKLFKNFQKCKRNRNGLQYVCRKCRKKIDHERYIRDPEKFRQKRQEYNKTHRLINKAYALKSKYGLTLQDWKILFKKQGKKCAICGSKKAGHKRGWVVDHDHKHGHTRSILCHHCNVLLGGAKDSIKTLERAIRYIKLWAIKKTLLGLRPILA